MENENDPQATTTPGDGKESPSTGSKEAAVTPTALQAALEPIGVVLANVAGELKEGRDSRAADAAAAAASSSQDEPSDKPSDQIDDTEFYNQGPAKSTRAIADAAVAKYHREVVEPKQKRDEESDAVRIQRETDAASKSIEHLQNFGDVKDAIHANMKTVKNPDTLTNPQAWERAYDMEIGRRMRESNVSNSPAGLPPSDVGASREAEGPSAEQIEIGRKLGLSKEGVKAGFDKLKAQDERALKAV